MKYFKKKWPGFTIVYLHNSHECPRCQSVTRPNFEYDLSPQKFMCKKSSTAEFLETFEPIRQFFLEKKLKTEEEQLSLTVKPHSVKSLKKSKKPKKAKLNKENSKKLKTLSLQTKKDSKCKKKSAAEKCTILNSVKKKSDKKVNGSKVPGKGTLKRKRWYLEKLKNENENYEDDLFENQKFGHFQNLLMHETDSSDKYDDLETPAFPYSITPREKSPSPKYRDCYNPVQLSIKRKDAEEYHYRRQKRKKMSTLKTKEEAPSANPQSKDDDIRKRLEEVARILKEHETQSEVKSDCEDDYFSDLFFTR